MVYTKQKTILHQNSQQDTINWLYYDSSKKTTAIKPYTYVELPAYLFPYYEKSLTFTLWT